MSEKLITEYLKASNGVGATLEQIVAATGTTSGTARRVLADLSGASAIKVENSRYKWVLDPSSVIQAIVAGGAH